MTKPLALISLAVLLVSVPFSSGEDKVKGRGFGDDYDWWSFEAGLKESQATGKPARHAHSMILCELWASIGCVTADE